MPELSRFYGIVVQLFYGDHPPPHIHVRYGEHRARVAIDSCALIDGVLPARAQGLLVEWMVLHRTELMVQWQRAARHQPLEKIDPLP